MYSNVFWGKKVPHGLWWGHYALCNVGLSTTIGPRAAQTLTHLSYKPQHTTNAVVALEALHTLSDPPNTIHTQGTHSYTHTQTHTQLHVHVRTHRVLDDLRRHCITVLSRK